MAGNRYFVFLFHYSYTICTTYCQSTCAPITTTNPPGQHFKVLIGCDTVPVYVYGIVGLFGDKSSFGLLIRYYDNRDTFVKIDGSGDWQNTLIETRSGIADKYDLFIGSKIKVFGRHLTICSCSVAVCGEIDSMGNKLRSNQEWLRSKIESVGAVPVVPAPKDMNKDALQLRYTSTGKANLRKLFTDNNRLIEQMCTLGLSHLVEKLKQN